MAHLATPPASHTIKTLSEFLQVSGDWHAGNAGVDQGMLSELWYRGVNTAYPHQAPGVYRPGFTERAKSLKVAGGLEQKRLRLERDMLSQFRTAGAAFLSGYNR